MEPRFRLIAAEGTHPGQLRQVNQDNVMTYIRSPEMGIAMGLFIVADGMGGHKAGEIASQLAVDTIVSNLSWMLEQDDIGSTMLSPSKNSSNEADEDLGHFEQRLKLAVEEANRVIYEYAQEHPTDAGNLGCTVTCALLYGEKAFIANVGDSRTYRWHEGELVQITDDHSYVWQLVSEGYIQLEEIFDHPQRNVITRALGNQPEVEVDTWLYTLGVGDRLLLCSDGMWEMIHDQAEIASMMESEKIESAVNQLVEAANGYGGHDNIGVVIVELQSRE